ncbi:hypothetical protein CapIbe_007712 [Capra ibex]
MTVKDLNSHQSAWSSAAALGGRQAVGIVSPANRQGNRGSARRRNLVAGSSSLLPPSAWPSLRRTPTSQAENDSSQNATRRGNRKWGWRRDLVSAASAAGGDWFREILLQV